MTGLLDVIDLDRGEDGGVTVADVWLDGQLVGHITDHGITPTTTRSTT